jgi:hypothetical protein
MYVTKSNHLYVQNLIVPRTTRVFQHTFILFYPVNSEAPHKVE